MLCKKCKLNDINQYDGPTYNGKYLDDELCWSCYETYTYIRVFADVKIIPDDLIIANTKNDSPIYHANDARRILKERGIDKQIILIKKKDVYMYHDFLKQCDVNLKYIYSNILEFFGKDKVWYRTDGGMIIDNESYYGKFCDDKGEVIFNRNKKGN